MASVDSAPRAGRGARSRRSRSLRWRRRSPSPRKPGRDVHGRLDGRHRRLCKPATAARPARLRQLVNSVPAGSTISVPAGTYTLTAGELLIDQNLTITGAGARTTTVEQNPPAGTPTARVFDIQKDPTSGARRRSRSRGSRFSSARPRRHRRTRNAGGNVLNEGTLTLSEDEIVLGETTGGAGRRRREHRRDADDHALAARGQPQLRLERHRRHLRRHRQRRQWRDDGDGDGQQLDARQQHRPGRRRRDRKPLHPMHQQHRHGRRLDDLQQRRRHRDDQRRRPDRGSRQQYLGA